MLYFALAVLNLLNQLHSIIFIAAVSPHLLVFEFLRILTVLCKELAYATIIIAVQFMIVGEAE